MIKGKLFLSDNEVKTIDGWKVPYVNGEDAKLFSYTVTSVSYTHLDVYKRQELLCRCNWIYFL